jgi:hypothetical protein
VKKVAKHSLQFLRIRGCQTWLYGRGHLKTNVLAARKLTVSSSHIADQRAQIDQLSVEFDRSRIEARRQQKVPGQVPDAHGVRFDAVQHLSVIFTELGTNRLPEGFRISLDDADRVLDVVGQHCNEISARLFECFSFAMCR